MNTKEVYIETFNDADKCGQPLSSMCPTRQLIGLTWRDMTWHSDIRHRVSRDATNRSTHINYNAAKRTNDETGLATWSLASVSTNKPSSKNLSKMWGEKRYSRITIFFTVRAYISQIHVQRGFRVRSRAMYLAYCNSTRYKCKLLYICVPPYNYWRECSILTKLNINLIAIRDTKLRCGNTDSTLRGVIKWWMKLYLLKCVQVLCRMEWNGNAATWYI
jgi:hypothetical protein